jgi:hypothetical protein
MKSQFDVFARILLSVFIVMALSNVANAEHEYDYFGDRLSREHRDASDVDEWIERGNATITASPRFEDGIRLTAWASKHSEGDADYEFAIASAIYFFEIPSQAQYIEISVRYRGEAHESDFEDYEPIAGRVWVRNTKREHAQRSYDDKGAEETLYGDTFALRAKRRSETIKIATSGHVDEGLLEMHLVAEDGQQLDVEHIDVSTYRRQPDIQVYPRSVRHYDWQPWHRYTYLYFYDGPFYYSTDLGYYIRWSYPSYDRHYFSIRHSYSHYLHNYYAHHHHPYYYRPYNRVNIHVHQSRPAARTRLNRWSGEHETTRREYARSRLSQTARTPQRATVNSRVSTVIQKHRQDQSALVERVSQSPVTSEKRKRSSDRVKLNTTIEQRQNALRSRSSRVSPRSGQTYTKSKRYSGSSSADRSDYNHNILSNAERRARIYQRSQSTYTPPSRVSPSNRQSSSSVKTRRGSSSGTSRRASGSSSARSQASTQKSTSASPSSRSSTVRRSPSSSSSSSSSSSTSSDDDDEKKSSRSSSRSQTRDKVKRR